MLHREPAWDSGNDSLLPYPNLQSFDEYVGNGGFTYTIQTLTCDLSESSDIADVPAMYCDDNPVDKVGIDLTDNITIKGSNLYLISSIFPILDCQ